MKGNDVQMISTIVLALLSGMCFAIWTGDAGVFFGVAGGILAIVFSVWNVGDAIIAAVKSQRHGESKEPAIEADGYELGGPKR